MSRSRLIAASLASLSVLGCGDGSTLPDGTLEPVRVGVVVSLTGNLSTLGNAWLNSAQLAAQEVNAAGGVLPGRRVELVIEDDQTDMVVGGRVGQELVAEDVVAIIGGGASSVSKAIAASAGPAHIPQISCCSTSSDLSEVQTPNDSYFFRTVGSDLVQGTVVARQAIDMFGCETMTLFVQNDTYGTPFGAAIEARFTDFGGTVVASVPFATGRPSYQTEVDAVVAMPTECVTIVGFGKDAGQIRVDWDTRGGPSTIVFIGTDGVKDDSFVQAAGSVLADGFRGTAPFSGVRSGTGATAQFATFHDYYQSVFDAQPVIFASSQYDAAALVFLAIARAGTTDGTQVRNALFEVANLNAGERVFGPGELDQAIAEIRLQQNDIDYQGASGPVELDTSGNVRSDYELWHYDSASGQFVTDVVIRAAEIEL